KMVGVGYAYDYTTSELSTVSSGSHELTLRVLF
ncbi:MAG: type IX secretion system membrane protein PorP/SprF, partial [Flavobacterium sp.]